jgi:hypothetical protein
VWVTRSGSLTGPPLLPPQLRGRISATAVLVPLVLGLLLCLVGHSGRVLLARRRLADWDRAWRRVTSEG